MTTPHTGRPRADVRTVLSFSTALVAVVLAALALLAPGANAATAAAAKGPTYGAWTSSVYGVSARVAPADAAFKRTYVQIRRSASESTTGDRQVRISWQKTGQAVHTAPARLLRPGAQTTYKTATNGCGKTMTVTLQGRVRASSSSAWSAWQSFGAKVTRSC